MPEWTIAAAQYAENHRSVRENVAHHLRFIEVAALQDCDVLVFPELALTGSEYIQPLPPPPGDELLQPLSYAASRYHMTIITGLPIEKNGQRSVGVAVFVPGRGAPLTFTQGHGTCLTERNHQVSIIGRDAEGNDIDASAALLATGERTDEFYLQQSIAKLQQFAHKYAIAVLKSDSAGGSSLWDENGQLIVRADIGELLLTGRKFDTGWEGDIIPLCDGTCPIDEYACGA